MEEAIDEELMGDGPKDHAQIIIKRKRTQRQRPLSPIPISMVPFPTLSSSGDGDRDGGYGDNNINATTADTTTTSSTSVESVVTDKEEDVANCLILLSQGPPKVDGDDHEKIVSKFTSKRYLETPWMGGGGSGKAGTYVYQCKTCDRTFSSFQALGGHRASHTRPKLDKDIDIDTGYNNDHEEQMRRQYMPPSLYLHGNNNPKASSKVHECSICGVEFSSGQALGGHMRRHRASIGANSSFSSSPSPSPIGCELVAPEAKKARIGLSLDLGLDLNLPAPEDLVHLQRSKEGFTSKQQEQQSQQQQQQQQQQQSPIGMGFTLKQVQQPQQQQQQSPIGLGFKSKQQEQQSQQQQQQQQSPIGLGFKSKQQEQQQQQSPIGTLSVAPDTTNEVQFFSQPIRAIFCD